MTVRYTRPESKQLGGESIPHALRTTGLLDGVLKFADTREREGAGVRFRKRLGLALGSGGAREDSLAHMEETLAEFFLQKLPRPGGRRDQIENCGRVSRSWPFPYSSSRKKPRQA